MNEEGDYWERERVRIVRESREPRIDLDQTYRYFQECVNLGHAWMYVFGGLSLEDETRVVSFVIRLRKEGYVHARYGFWSKWLCGVTYRVDWDEPQPTRWMKFVNWLRKCWSNKHL